MKKILASVAALLVASTVAHAEVISLVNSASDFTDASTSVSDSFDMLTGNALVVAVANRTGGGDAAITASFAGQDMSSVLFQGSDGDRASVEIFMLLNPTTTSGNLDITVGDGRWGYAAYALDNVAGLYATNSYGINGNADNTTDLSYDALAGGYVITAMTGEGPGTGTPEITGDNIDLTPLNTDIGVDYGSGQFWATLESTGGQVASAGTYTNTFYAYQALADGVVSLQAIPEPATIGLIGLMGGGLLFIRRRMMM